MLDKDNLSPAAIADHLAQLMAKPLPKRPPKKKAKTTKGKKGKKGAGPVDTPPVKELTIQLWGAHRINGVPYGPGTVTLPRELALQLANADQRARAYDDNWHRPKAVIVGAPVGTSGHRTTTVPSSLFDSPTLNIPEVGFASEGGFTSG